MRPRGILYVCFGEQYALETRRSIRSLRRVSALPVAVVTDQPWRAEPVPDEFVIRPAVRSFRCKPLYVFEASPFLETLFLDTDTVIARDVTPAFGLLRHYDVGVRFFGPQLGEPDGLELHLQCTSGVVLFRRNEKTDQLSRLWLKLYDEAVTSHATADARGIGDQRYLAIAIARSQARPVHLGEYLNFVLTETITTYSPPLVYHGRQAYIERVAASVNAGWDSSEDWHVRLWLQNIAGFLPRGIRRSDPVLALALIARRVYNELRWRLGRGA